VSLVNNQSNIYIFDRSNREFQSLDVGWDVSPHITPDDRYVVFFDVSAQSLVYLFHRSTATSELVSQSSTGELARQSASSPSVSDDGRFVAFSSLADNLATGDAPEERDIFLRDRRANTTELVSRSYDGNPPDGESDSAVISGDGRYIAFWSWASNLGRGHPTVPAR
jgi:Tol biopolymer transport system component